jgi:hypothetical protein
MICKSCGRVHVGPECEAHSIESVVTQADLDYAAGCFEWSGGVFSVSELAIILADYAHKTREECAKIADDYVLSITEDAQVATERATQEARETSSYERQKAILQYFKECHHILHGKRYGGVEIAKKIRALITNPITKT